MCEVLPGRTSESVFADTAPCESQPTCLTLSLLVFPFLFLSSSSKCMHSVQLSTGSGVCAAWQSLLTLQLLCSAFPIRALRQGCPQSFWFTMETSWGGYVPCVPSSLLFSLMLLSSPYLPKYFEFAEFWFSPLCV